MVREPSFLVSFILSIVVHLMILGGAAAAYWHKPPSPPKTVERLVVQLEGTVSRKQTEEIIAVEEKPEEPPPKPKPKPKEKPLVPKKVPLSEEAIIERIKPDEPPPVVAPQAPVAQVDINQEAQRINAVQNDMQAISRYLVSFKKKLSKHLVYPREARKGEAIGMPSVQLSILEDGTILEGSLSIVKSSGHSILDAAAIDAVRQSSPFPPPPRRLENVVVEIVFNVE